MAIEYEVTRLPNGSGKPLWARGGAKAGYKASYGCMSAVGETKAQAADALIADLVAQATAHAYVWNASGSAVFVVRALGADAWGYEIIGRGKSGGCYVGCGADRDAALRAAERHAAQYTE